MAVCEESLNTLADDILALEDDQRDRLWSLIYQKRRRNPQSDEFTLAKGPAVSHQNTSTPATTDDNQAWLNTEGSLILEALQVDPVATNVVDP